MQRPAAIASCEYCHWQAKHTDDTEVEVMLWLRLRLLEHINDAHRDRFTAGVDDHVVIENGAPIKVPS